MSTCKPLPPQVLSGKHNAVRWQKGERLNHLFEHSCARFGNSYAVITDDVLITYRELNNRANQVCRYLIDQGVKPGDRVGVLFDKSAETYVALLAVMKANAAYVPLDPSFPTERVRFILADADIKAVVSMSRFEASLNALDVHPIYLETAKQDIDSKPHTRITDAEAAAPVDQVCYILYTSGTTGHPKGVVIEHPSICNFVRIAAELYGIAPGDRVYQGMTIAFDFSVEEIWVPLMAGATLIPGPQGITLLGEELADFLRNRAITCLCCCPTLLATIEDELEDIRILLLGGEACPHNLVVRWHRAGRTILNSYGPTEATVTATLTSLTPNKPVTIGVPLPTYSIVILDPDTDQVVPRDEVGEIGIAGVGLAAGYLNREELTKKKFIPDFLGLPNNPSRRIYRTGDLGRVNADNEVEYHGRIDTQVKIRGYRIELVEIESVLLELSQIAQATVATCEPEPGRVELVAYYSLKQGASGLSRNEIAQVLRKRLPTYMVPTFLEELPFIPMLISNKVDHNKMPKPKALSHLAAGRMLVLPKTETEHIIAREFAEVMKLDCISISDHFFDVLGANSLLMARFCARLRRYRGMSNVSMRDVYLHPTVAMLAEHLGSAANKEFAPGKREPFHVPSDFAYYSCGALQLLFYVGYGLLGLWLLDTGLNWIDAALADPIDLCLRSVVFAVVSFIGLTAIAIAAKWLLIGKWKTESIPIWSLRYFRFWVIMTLVRSAPVVAFVGHPIFNIYLRLLGARIGRGAVVGCRFIPVCTDLVSIGENTILRKDSMLLGYRAQSNFIHTGTIEIGSNAFVGEASVLDINTEMGDGAQLGHASSLQSGQRIPGGKRYHGSPAMETEAEYCPIDGKRSSSLRRGLYQALELSGLFAVVAPVPILTLIYWEHYFVGALNASFGMLTRTMLLISAASFFGSLAMVLAIIYIVPRLCMIFLDADKTYRLFGIHYWLQTVVSQISNSQFMNTLFGDSSFIVHYLRFVGWNLNKVEQTGSNLGTNQKHDNPFLCDIGTGTMISNGLSIINMHMSSSSFQLGKTRIDDRSYLGNRIHYPLGGCVRANCLLATKVMIPVNGPVRENVGLLGSPCFEIPRMVDRDRRLNAALSGAARRQGLRRKNLHNFITASLFLLTRWLFYFTTLMGGELALLAYPQYGVFSFFTAGVGLSLAAILFFALIERASLGFKRLEPQMVTIYEPYFWRHERHWKLSDSIIVLLFAGTPFKNLISWLLGVKIGRKVYDANCTINDRTLVEIGDYANLNEGSELWAHSLEEGVFKSDYIRMGKGCTLGPGSCMQYGVSLGDHVVLDADSFLMKGEVLDALTVWRGNPARLFRRNTAPAIEPPSLTSMRDAATPVPATMLAQPTRGSRRGSTKQSWSDQPEQVWLSKPPGSEF